MELGKRIAEIRKDHHLTQENLAEICNVTRQTISNWENGKSCPDLETLVLISDTFDVSLDVMLKEDKRMVSEITKEQKQGRKYRTSKIIFAVIAAAAVIACIIFLIETPWFLKMEYETANEKDYSKCLRLVDNLPGVSEAFPEKIPVNAKEVVFNAYNNIGGRSLSLSFIAEDAEMQAYIDKAKSIALCFGTKDDSQIAQALPSHKLSSLNNEASVFVLYSEPYRPNDFNHAKLVWIVVNEKTHSITFSAESY